MLRVILTFLFLTTVVRISAQEELSTDLGRWLATLPLDARIADEMGRFTHDETELSEGYRSARVASMRKLIIMEADQAVAALLLGACEPSVEVTYPRKDDPISRFSESGMAAEHSQVVWNEGQDPYQDVYYKENVKTFVQVPGGLALHYLNYSRTTNMGRMQRWFGTRSIEDSQRDSAKLMAQRLASQNP